MAKTGTILKKAKKLTGAKTLRGIDVKRAVY
jgi:hypothetical protein